jgi:outer membrane protein assembly factor BamB
MTFPQLPLPALALTAILLAPLSASADPSQNWAHWRGHGGNGVSTTATPPTTWSETANVKWKVEIPGRGSGSPVIWEDRVFVTSAVPEAGGGGKLSFQLFCFDRATGALRWKQTSVTATPHEGTHETNTFASASPCTDGERVYAPFGSRGLFCYDLEGKLLWSKTDFPPMTTRNGFGEGSSPTLAGDTILVPWDHEGPSALYALNKKTGALLWTAKRGDEPTCWATPLVVEAAGKSQVIMNGQTKARAYDLATGEELWNCGGQTERPVASAVFADGLAFVGSGFRGSFLGAFRLDGKGDIEGTEHVVWQTKQDTPDIASPLLSGGRLYFCKGKSGILTCLEAATGKVLFGPERIHGISSTYASPVAAGGHVYLTDRSGTITVIKDGTKLEVVATNSLGQGVDATPAPVGGQLFVRGERQLFCLGE